MLAQVLGAERERFLLGAKNTYILEGNWPSGAAFRKSVWTGTGSRQSL